MIPSGTASSVLRFALAAAFVAGVQANPYNKVKQYKGSDFLSWSFATGADLTHGAVNYLGSQDAQNAGLAKVNSDGSFHMAVDSTSTGVNRNSVRIQSNEQYEDAVIILDLAHMPQGCGTWPAFWTVGSNWPANGEIDILEGVNDEGPNAATLHTTPGCTMGFGSETGTPVSTNCDTSVNGNQGCQVKFNQANSYSEALNSAGGGYFAMQRDQNAGIFIWFWARNSGGIPSDVTSLGGSVDVSGWGTPTASFPFSGSCSNSHFGPHNIVFDLTLCGDWAGSVFPSAPCAQALGTTNCVSFAQNTPSAFTNAYWTVNSVWVGQM